jgi:hypothetical protein
LRLGVFAGTLALAISDYGFPAKSQSRKGRPAIAYLNLFNWPTTTNFVTTDFSARE